MAQVYARHRLLLTASIALAASGPTAAGAHVLGPEFVPVFDGISPPASSIRVTVRTTGGAPELTIQVLRGVLELDGLAAEPFARVGDGGTFMNETAPTTLVARDPMATPRAHAEFAAGEPLWRRVSDGRELRYFESRAEWPGSAPPEEVRKRGKRAAILRWIVGGRLDGAPLQIYGHVDWVPRSFDPTILLLGTIVIGIAIAAAWPGARRRVGAGKA